MPINSNSRTGWIKSIKIGFTDSRGYYISELTPNPDVGQPTLFEAGRFIHEFNCLMNHGMDIEAYEKTMKERLWE
ncbi:hypothetical protein LCGC14_2384660 [marine sediment metagenome]|uniref:Uncharacterized protein n=1 Tax=marine sediment metagenome TaxID=412755 RepID=A0A0F9CM25_9ZZZZ